MNFITIKKSIKPIDKVDFYYFTQISQYFQVKIWFFNFFSQFLNFFKNRATPSKIYISIWRYTQKSGHTVEE